MNVARWWTSIFIALVAVAGILPEAAAQVSVRIGRFAVGSADGLGCLTPDDTNPLNSCGDHPVAELHEQTACGYDIVLYCAPTPGTAVDGSFVGRYSFPIKPPSRDAIRFVVHHEDGVDGVPRGNKKPVAAAKIFFAYGFKPFCLIDHRIQCGYACSHITLFFTSKVRQRPGLVASRGPIVFRISDRIHEIEYLVIVCVLSSEYSLQAVLLSD